MPQCHGASWQQGQVMFPRWLEETSETFQNLIVSGLTSHIHSGALLAIHSKHTYGAMLMLLHLPDSMLGVH